MSQKKSHKKLSERDIDNKMVEYALTFGKFLKGNKNDKIKAKKKSIDECFDMAAKSVSKLMNSEQVRKMYAQNPSKCKCGFHNKQVLEKYRIQAPSVFKSGTIRAGTSIPQAPIASPTCAEAMVGSQAMNAKANTTTRMLLRIESPFPPA